MPAENGAHRATLCRRDGHQSPPLPTSGSHCHKVERLPMQAVAQGGEQLKCIMTVTARCHQTSETRRDASEGCAPRLPSPAGPPKLVRWKAVGQVSDAGDDVECAAERDQQAVEVEQRFVACIPTV